MILLLYDIVRIMLFINNCLDGGFVQVNNFRFNRRDERIVFFSGTSVTRIARDCKLLFVSQIDGTFLAFNPRLAH